MALVVCGLVSAQVQKNVDDFEFLYGYKDYLNDTPRKANVSTEIGEVSPKIFYRKETFRYKDTGKRARNENQTWAIKYGDEYYLNMSNIPEMGSPTFMKVDVVGKKYWAIFLNEGNGKCGEKSNKMSVASSINSRGGMGVGVMFKINNAKEIFKNQNGDKCRIALIDFGNPSNKSANDMIAFPKIINTDFIIQLMNNEEITQKIKNKEYTIEDFAEYLEKRNNGY